MTISNPIAQPVRKHIKSINHHDIEGTVNQAIEFFAALKVEYADRYHELDITTTYYHSDGHEIELYGTRLETYEEIEKRLIRAKKEKDRKDRVDKEKKDTTEAIERREYERPSKKFGKQ